MEQSKLKVLILSYCNLQNKHEMNSIVLGVDYMLMVTYSRVVYLFSLAGFPRRKSRFSVEVDSPRVRFPLCDDGAGGRPGWCAQLLSCTLCWHYPRLPCICCDGIVHRRSNTVRSPECLCVFWTMAQ